VPSAVSSDMFATCTQVVNAVCGRVDRRPTVSEFKACRRAEKII
jgi:hypothetical protein